MSNIKYSNIPQMSVQNVVEHLSNAYSVIINNNVPIKTFPSVVKESDATVNSIVDVGSNNP